MTNQRLIHGALISLSAVMAIPPVNAMAESRTVGSRPPSRSRQNAAVSDIALGAGGKLTGRVVDQSGQALEGARVTLLQGGRELRQTVTNNEGQYSFESLQGGIYTIASGPAEGVIRTWADKTAPPIAKQHAMLVVGTNGVRGQIGTIAATQALAAVGAVPIVALGTLNSSYSGPAVLGSATTTSSSAKNEVNGANTGTQSLRYDPTKDPNAGITSDPLPYVDPIPASP